MQFFPWRVIVVHTDLISESSWKDWKGNNGVNAIVIIDANVEANTRSKHTCSVKVTFEKERRNGGWR